MKIPTLPEAQRLLDEAHARNPGPWRAHSINVGRAAQYIAQATRSTLKLDPNICLILGMLHDIGRREGVTGMRHIYDGYQFLQTLGYDDAARICLTHSLPDRNLKAVFGGWDCSPDEMAFIEQYLVQCVYDDYDRLLQLCDAIAMDIGFVLMEKRLVDVILRYGGTNSHTLAKIHEYFALQTYFSQHIGASIYSVLPGVIETTFER